MSRSGYVAIENIGEGDTITTMEKDKTLVTSTERDQYGRLVVTAANGRVIKGLPGEVFIARHAKV